MFKLTAGAMHRARDDARHTAAQDLVSRTLAQHGLMPGGAVLQTPSASQSGASSLFAGLKGLGNLPGMTPTDTPSAAGAHGMTPGQFTCAAGSRAYLLHVPDSAKDSAKGGATGLVVMLHGCTQNPADFAAGTAMNALADRHGFVVLYPQQSRGDNAQSCWNWFSRGDQLRDKGEPAILAGMTQDIASRHGVAADRTCVAGLSAGAAMAVILGQTYPDVFSAVGAHSGLPYAAARDVPQAFAAMAGRGADVPAPDQRTTLRTIVFHGTADATVAPVNGDRIAAHAKTAGLTQSLESDHSGQTAGRGWQQHVSADMKGRPLLEHWVIDGLGHAWSGGKPGGSYTDAKGPDASAEMVRFFFDPAAD